MAVVATACPADTLAVVRDNDQVPVTSPYRIALTSDEQRVLAARAQSLRGSYRDRLRAQIVLAAAGGSSNAAIAAQLGTHAGTARKWRRRFAATRLAGLKDAPRSGRPPVFTAADQAEVIALACALPAETGTPLSAWSSPDLARELGIDHPPVAGQQCPQTLAAPVLDLRARPRIRRQGRPGTGPLRRDLGRRAARPGRLCDLRR
jgi:transposase